MKRSRIGTLRRLVRVAALLYRQQAAQVALLSRVRSEIAGSAESAELALDGVYTTAAAFPELAIARATRLRQQLAEADSRLEAQVEVASGSLAGLRGAESRLGEVQARADQAASVRTLDEVIEGVARRRQTSLEQA
jgi:membrane-bound lytic murein transglycosylase B